MTFAALVGQWPLIEQDLADVGIDVGDPALLTGRSWRWLRCRIEGLITRPWGYAPNGEPVFTSRLQAHVYEPVVKEARARRANR